MRRCSISTVAAVVAAVLLVSVAAAGRASELANSCAVKSSSRAATVDQVIAAAKGLLIVGHVAKVRPRCSRRGDRYRRWSKTGVPFPTVEDM